MINDYLRKINSFFKYYFYFFKNYKLIKNSKSFSQEGEDKFLLESNNPPSLIIEFFKEQTNISKINCFSNEGGEWKNSKLNYKDKKIEVVFTEKFLPRRGRINCSMQDNEGWRWFGTQFTLN